VFSVEELRDAAPFHLKKKISRAADLTFGTYRYLLKEDARWAKLHWNLDKELFIDLLTKVGDIRNELMHFTPDPLSSDKYKKIHGLLELLRTVDPRP
jgi:restriction system protein